ncbi:hypothetical protein JT247_06725, partial [Helicobacter pylori]|nr:hypothetical protein [Helicobacter pylori]
SSALDNEAMRERESKRDFFMFSPFNRFFFDTKKLHIISNKWNFMANFSSKFWRFCCFANWEKWGV